jgi:hypothetical protein
VGLQGLQGQLPVLAKVTYNILGKDVSSYHSQAYYVGIACESNLDLIYRDAAHASDAVYKGTTVIYNGKSMEDYSIVSQSPQGSEATFYLLQATGKHALSKPFIFAIRGTDNLKDAVNDASLGNTYLQDLLNQPGAKAAILSKIEQGYDVTITGHSLGGGLSEGLAAEIEHQLALDQYNAKGKLKLGKLRVATFNGTGGQTVENEFTQTQELKANSPTDPQRAQIQSTMKATAAAEKSPAYRKIDKTLKQSILGQTVNFELDGDKVSKLGCHYGQIRTIQNDALMVPEQSSVGDAGSLYQDHQIENVGAMLDLGATTESVGNAPNDCALEIHNLATESVTSTTAMARQTNTEVTNTEVAVIKKDIQGIKKGTAAVNAAAGEVIKKDVQNIKEGAGKAAAVSKTLSEDAQAVDPRATFAALAAYLY